jgi:signal peptidase I
VQLSTAIMPTNSKLGVEERVMVTKVSVISGMYVIETSVTVEVAEVLRAFLFFLGFVVLPVSDFFLPIVVVISSSEVPTNSNPRAAELVPT